MAAPQTGVLSKITHGDGDDVKVGEVLGVIDESASARPTADKRAGSSGEAGKPQPGKAEPPKPQGEAAASAEATTPKDLSGEALAKSATSGEATAARDLSAEALAKADKTRATPAARNVAQQNEVDLRQVRGSGEAGRVMKRDVEAVASSPAAPAPRVDLSAVALAKAEAKPSIPLREDRRQSPGDRTEERVRMSKRRATIARRLIEAQSTAAMLTTFNEVDMTGVMAVRERHKQTFKERFGVNLGLTSFFVKAAVGALRDFPRINAEIQGDEMVLKHYFDIGVAVGAKEGLVVPVLRDADRMSFAQIERRVREFAKAAEDGTLSLADLKGGTFTITNGGVLGSLLSTPILNPPQVGILGLHAIKDRPVAVDKQVVIRPMMYIALTYDHRMVDGSEAVQFLVRVKQLVEDPGALLLE